MYFIIIFRNLVCLVQACTFNNARFLTRLSRVRIRHQANFLQKNEMVYSNTVDVFTDKLTSDDSVTSGNI